MSDAIEPERRAACVLDEVGAARRSWERTNRRSRALSAREAIAAIQFECLLVWAYGKSLLTGHTPSDDDEARVSIAMRRITEITDEAIG